MGIFPEGEDSRGDHGLGRLVEFRFKGPPGTTSSYITTHTSSGQRNCTSWASQPQKSVTFLPCPGGRTTKSTRTCGGIGGGGIETQNLGLRALLALHPPISPLTHHRGQRNCTSWVSQPQKSVTLLPCPGGRTTKLTRACGGTGGGEIIASIGVNFCASFEHILRKCIKNEL